MSNKYFKEIKKYLKKNKKLLFSRLLLTIVSILILSLPSFYNQFPFVFSDTGAYIKSGFENYPLTDRPITYGLFIRISSLNISLWLTLFTQVFFVFFVLRVLYLTFKKRLNFVGEKEFIFSITFLTIFSSLGLTSNTLMPDIFSSTLLISIFLIYLKKNNSLIKLFLCFIVYISILMHLSNGIAAISSFIIYLLILKFLFQEPIITKNNLLIILILFISMPSLLLINNLKSATNNIYSSKYAFVLGRLINDGIYEMYLDEKCPNVPYNICAIKSYPTNINEYLWEKNELITNLGTIKDIDGKQEKIVKNIITEPKLYFPIIYKSILKTFQQLTEIFPKISSNPYDEEAFVSINIAEFFKYENNDYINSKQNKNQINLKFLSYLQHLVFLVFIFIDINLIPKIFYDKKYLYEIKFVLFSIIFIIINAFFSSSLSGVTDRYNSKIIWTLIVGSSLLIFRYSAINRKKLRN